MNPSTRQRLVLLIAAWLGWATLALAQTFPSKVVKITAPYAAGAAPAIFTRMMADKLSKAWSQPVIVDAKPGASGFIAIEVVKNAAPDGHELLVVSSAHVAINPALYKKLPYDPRKDFVPVAMFYHTPFFLTVSTAGPYQSVPALINAAKANPGTVSYGSSYVGSPSHLGSAEFEFLTGTKMIHVPYKDQSQMYVAIAGGDVGWAFSTLGSALHAHAKRAPQAHCDRRQAPAQDAAGRADARGGRRPRRHVRRCLACGGRAARDSARNRAQDQCGHQQAARGSGGSRATHSLRLRAGARDAGAASRLHPRGGKKFAELVRRTGATAD